jgi:hypothetical protein
MIKKQVIPLLIIAVFLVGCGKKNISSELDYYKLIKTEPIQEELDDEKTIKLNENFSLTELYSYKISAKVLHKKEYSDEYGIIAPLDLALGWNKMSSGDLLKKSKISISQSNRFYFWRVPSFNYLSRQEIENNSANVHIVPSNEKIKDYLIDEVNKDDEIYLEGFLVNLKHESNGSFRKTSVKRTDTGSGACEILYVTKVEHLLKSNQ